MALNTLSYTTPSEFVTYYSEMLKQDLEAYDIQISKVGFLGYLLHVLGYTNYDLKMYYENLFKEAFIATAQDEESQFVHSSIHGYIPTFAKPSNVTGTIEFDMVNFLPRRGNSIIKREVILGYNVEDGKFEKYDTLFTVNDHIFNINAVYKFIEEKRGNDYIYYTDIITEDGIRYNLPASSSVITVPLYSTIQEQKKEITINIPSYPYGSFYTYYFSIDIGQYLSGIDIYVSTEDGEQTEELYTIKYVKYLESSTSKCVFLRKLTTQRYILEFGSGLRGVWLSNSTIRLVIKYCEGSSGNLINNGNTKSAIDIPGLLSYDYEYDNGGNLIPVSPSINVIQKPIVSLQYSEGGTDPLSGEDLRDDIIRYIQTRDNLVSELDFYNIAKMYLNDFKFAFKKTHIFDNTFYLYRSFRDKNQNICRSTTHTQEILNIKYDMDTISLTGTSSDDNGLSNNADYYYCLVGYSDNLYTTQSNIKKINTGSFNSIAFTWNALSNIKKYRLFRGDAIDNLDVYWDFNFPILTYVDFDTDKLNVSETIFLPNSLTITNTSTGGILGNGEYFYIVEAYSENGETIQTFIDYISISNGVNTNKNTLTWNEVPNASKYRIYGRLLNSDQYLYWDVYNTTTFVDNESIKSSNILSIPKIINLSHEVIASGFDSSPITYSYSLVALDDWGRSISTEALNVTLLTNHNCIHFEWDSVPNATKYHIYGRTIENKNNYWEILEPRNTFTDYNQSGTNKTFESMSQLNSIIYNPTFNINGDIFISPFLYMGDNNMGYYNGYILKTLMRLLFTKVTPDEKIYGTGFVIPNTYMNLVYDKVQEQSIFQLKTYNDLDDLVFNITIHGIPDYYEKKMEWDKIEQCFYCNYLNNDKHGLLTSDISVECVGGKSNTLLSEFSEPFNVTSQNNTLVFKFRRNANTNISDINWTSITLTPGNDKSINNIITDINNKIKTIKLDNQIDYLEAYEYDGRLGLKLSTMRGFPENTTQIYEIYLKESTYSTANKLFGFIGYDEVKPVKLNGPLNIVLFKCKTDMFSQLFDISDKLRLSKYFNITNNVRTDYLLGVPIILKETFDSDQDYYIDKIKNFISDSKLSGNRMISDNVQCRFLNTNNINEIELDSIFIQKSNIITENNSGKTIQLPLKLTINLKIDKNYIQRNQINLAIQKENLEILLAQYLQQLRTGTNIKLYNSQIIEFIHYDRPYIKSVEVSITDSNIPANKLNNGIEVKSNDQDIINSFNEDKVSIVKYTPPLIYWDVDNIIINTLMI